MTIERTTPHKEQHDTHIGNLIAYYAKEHIPSITRPDVAIANIERLTPFWGEIKLSDIRKSNSFEYLDHRRQETAQWQQRYGRKQKELSESSARRELEQLQAIINYCYQDNIIKTKPFVYKFKKSKARERWMTRSEVAALLWQAKKSTQAGDYLPLFILIGIYTGARKTSILKLRWTDINFKTGIIDFSRTANSDSKRGATTKIHRKLMIHLRYARRYGVEMGYVIHKNQKPIKDPKKAFAFACQRAGLENVTIHTMRHTCASWILQSNASSFKAAKHLGHTSPRMVEATYGHINEEFLKEVMDAFG